MTLSPKKIKVPRAVLFDYDGVLVASESTHLLAWMQLLTTLGLPNDRETVEKGVGKTAPIILTELLNRYKPDWKAADYDVHALAQQKNNYYLSYAQNQLQVYPGVKEGLQWLKSKKIPMAVVSNGRRREIDATMKQLGLFDFFDQIISRDDVNAHKPDPTPYLFAAASLHVEPHECIAIEDSPTGLEAALFAKIPVAAVMTNFSKMELTHPVPGRPDLSPVWLGHSIQDFFEWLKSIHFK